MNIFCHFLSKFFTHNSCGRYRTLYTIIAAAMKCRKLIFPTIIVIFIVKVIAFIITSSPKLFIQFKPRYIRFYELLNEVCDELPDDFFRELHYGVQLSEEYKLSPYAENGDIVIMGEYTRSGRGNKITIYYGSFARTCGWMPEEQLKDRLRGVVRHEFRHHMENLAGMYGADSLEHEDREEMKDIISARMQTKNGNKG